MFKFLAFTAFVATASCASFLAGAFCANEVCKENHGHGIIKDS